MDKLRELLKGRMTRSYVEKTPSDVYRELGADPSNQLSETDIEKIGGLESNHGKFEKPLQGGSARGLFQFKPETAEQLLPGSSEKLNDMNIQQELMKLYLQKNKPRDIEEAYLQHNLGKSGANKFLKSDENDPTEKAMSRSAISGNKNIYKDKTVKESKDLIRSKLDKSKQPNKLLDLIFNKE